MASRGAFGKQIVERARRIGWEVSNLPSGGWVIHCPDKHRVQVHLTPSDVNASEHIVQELNKHKFAEAEAEFARLSEDKRLARLKAAQEETQRRLDAAQKHADALARAAGQTRVPEEVLLNPYPVPKTFERVLVTPELAQKLLDLNTGNRPIRQTEVAFWQDVIERGLWRYTHQGVAVDSNGVLQDGQHRLSAIVAAEIAVEMQISVGMPPENFNAIDNGLRRTFGDVANRLGLGRSSRVGSAARVLLILNDYPVRSFGSKVSNAEVDEFLSTPSTFVEGHTNGEVLHLAANEAQLQWQSYRINHNAAAVLIYLLWEAFGKDHPKVEEFLIGLKTGADLSDKDSRLALRRMISAGSSRIPRTVQMHLALGIKAWNKFVKGADVHLLSFRPKVEDLPRLVTEIPETKKK